MAKVATIDVIRISMMVPFRIFLSMIPALKPTNITASVAAACPLLKPNMTLRWEEVYLNASWVKNAASHFPAIATIERVKATTIAI